MFDCGCCIARRWRLCALTTLVDGWVPLKGFRKWDAMFFFALRVRAKVDPCAGLRAYISESAHFSGLHSRDDVRTMAKKT